MTTSVYIPQDPMALTLNGTNQWPTAKELIAFGEGRSLGTRRSLTEILERVCEAISDASKDLRAHRKRHPEFAAIGGQMVKQWASAGAQSTARIAVKPGCAANEDAHKPRGSSS